MPSATLSLPLTRPTSLPMWSCTISTMTGMLLLSLCILRLQAVWHACRSPRPTGKPFCLVSNSLMLIILFAIADHNLQACPKICLYVCACVLLSINLLPLSLSLSLFQSLTLLSSYALSCTSFHQCAVCTGASAQNRLTKTATLYACPSRCSGTPHVLK